MNEAIYICMGTTGRDSDRTEWPVKAFKNKKTAQAFTLQLTQESKELMAKYKNDRNIWMYGPMDRSTDKAFEHKPELPPNDPNFEWDYTGMSYFLIQCPLEE